MTDLRQPFEDLVTEVPSYVVPDAAAAWAAGTRRRTRRRVGGAVVAAVLAVLVGGIVTQQAQPSELRPTDGDGASVVTGYPDHVERPWVEARLPDRPGPLAALVNEAGSHWHAVSASGQAWRVGADDPIDNFPPALSGDGRMIGYLEGRSVYVIRDLATGETTRFPEIGDNRGVPRTETYLLGAQLPSYWSPDGARLFVPAYPWNDAPGADGGLVLASDGSREPVTRRLGFLIGWLDSDTLAWLRMSGSGSAQKASLVGSRITGEVVSRVPLDLAAGALDDLSQWSATLSPDRDRMAVALADATGTLVTLSTSDGSVIRSEKVGADATCQVSWAGDEPAFFQFDGTLDTTDGRRLISVDPRYESSCLVAVADGLAGERHESVGARLFGESWLAWRWREVSLAGLGGLLLAGGIALLVARRRRVSE